MQENRLVEQNRNPNFIVITGYRSFPLYAADPLQAIALVKARIEARRERRKDPVIGMSLLNALDAGKLNFIVMDFDRTQLICGELNAIGDQTHMRQYQQEVTWKLAQSLQDLIPQRLLPHRPFDDGFGE